MRSHDSRSRRPVLETLEDRLLLAASLAPSGPPPILPIESFAAAVLLTPPQTGAGAKSAPTLHRVDGKAVHWYYPQDGGLTLNNHPPKAFDDSAATDAGLPIRIDVLANDTDADGDKLYVLYASKPAHGTLYRDAAHPNDLLYQPNAGYVGADSFAYGAYDRWGDCSDATVHILVTNGPQLDAVDRPPVARPDTARTRAGHLVVIDVLRNDSDPDGDKVKLVGIVRAAEHGHVAIRNGRVIYTPNADFAGDDSFTYRITDGHGDTALGQVTVHVAKIFGDAGHVSHTP